LTIAGDFGASFGFNLPLYITRTLGVLAAHSKETASFAAIEGGKRDVIPDRRGWSRGTYRTIARIRNDFALINICLRGLIGERP
jgi:hypothetical protein